MNGVSEPTPKKTLGCSAGQDGLAVAVVERETARDDLERPGDQARRHPDAGVVDARARLGEDGTGPLVVHLDAHRLEQAQAGLVDAFAPLGGELLEAHSLRGDQDGFHRDSAG